MNNYIKEIIDKEVAGGLGLNHSKFFESSGFQCMIHRYEDGMIAGYVSIPLEHPWAGKKMGDVPADIPHGVTYSCQIPKVNVESTFKKFAGTWVVGFDTAHEWDYIPREEFGLTAGRNEYYPPYNEYKTENDVKRELQNLAFQAKEATYKYTIEEIKSQGNIFNGALLGNILYLEDTNSGGMSLTNQIGTPYLYDRLTETFGEKYNPAAIYYLDSMGEAIAWIDLDFAKPDKVQAERLERVFPD